MSIDSDDNFEDIDKLLDEIDTVGNQKQKLTPLTSSTSGKNDNEENNGNIGTKLTLNSDGNGLKVNYGSGFKLSDLDPSKSVRFSENSSTVNRGPPKSNFISSLLQKDPGYGTLGDFVDSPSTTPHIPPSQFMSSTPKNPSNSLSSKPGGSDWLGIDTGRGEPSTPTFSPKTRVGGVSHNSTINFDEDSVGELLKTVEKTRDNNPSGTARPSTAIKKNKDPNPTKPKSGFDLDDDFWPKPTKPVVSSAPSNTASKSDTVEKPDFRSLLLQKAAMSSRGEVKETESTSSQQQKSQVKSIVDVLPFLSRKSPPAEDHDSIENVDRYHSISTSTSTQNPSVPTATATTKTGRIKKSAVAPPVTTVVESHKSTLQLPSHLIDEEELKSMCNSLKTLYLTQLELQEKSYQDQMECLAQSHSRKEELLREEIKIMHKEYDSRLERLRNELLDNETKMPQRLQNELSAMTSFGQQLQQQAAIQQAQFQHQSRPQPSNNVSVQNANASELNSPRNLSASNNNIILQDLDKILNDKLTSFLQTVQSYTKTEQSHGPNEETKELLIKLDMIHKKLDSSAKFKLEEESKKSLQIIEMEKNLQDEIVKLNKKQKKIKDSVVKAAVTSVNHALQYSNEENSHKKDKIASQLKEFRKDVRRILYDLEAKNEYVQKSHVNLESDQKHIIKSLRDIQTLMQVNSARVNLASEINMAHGFSSTATTSQAQSELELKLLKEERSALSESLAQINVERRKLNEEKINLERDKMDFERQKNHLRDLEVNLRVKTNEAQDMKQQAEEMRKAESSKALELTSRVSELERERIQFKEQHYASEQRLRIREQKLIQEKTEFMREKEFLEKLREQSLCPSCMKTLSHFTIASRSEGDGIDLSNTADFSSRLNTVNNNAILPVDAAYFQKESMYLDDLYYMHFNPK